MDVLLISIGLAIVAGLIFTAIGLISGSDETAVLVPATLIVVLLGAPPEAVFAFFMAAVLSKHLTHAIPTALMGVPGDTTATPMLDHANFMRRIGLPHIALRKMISGGIIGAFIALPVSLAFAVFLSQFGEFFQENAGLIFTLAAVLIGYFSKGRWASIILIIPLALVIQGLNMVSTTILGTGLSISFFLGIAIGPMFTDILLATSGSGRLMIKRQQPNEYKLAPEKKSWSGYFPNPFKVLTKKQTAAVGGTSFLSSLTFALSPVGMTALMGELVGSRIKGQYKKSTASLSTMNGVTESTYIAETIIPLVAFGIPLSPVAIGPAQALFNAPPVFTTEPVHNLHTLMEPMDFLLYGLIGIIVAAVIAYPFSMNFARKATVLVLKHINQEAIIAMFIGVVTLLAFYEGGLVSVSVTFAMAMVGGLLNRFLGVGIGVQFMIFYGSGWIVTTLLGM
ncbi:MULTISPECIES: tripartite tricarboxylate transporter permease [Oceanobacillus]|uniref:Tripartite tricarboxylate transporter TctA family protein n=2 Tax=Oceanobacillus TaxID=182709 RepID=A0A0A1MD50_9BACI|nr:tripartite tricarboxylate transporter permease [Oceanobacillus oncorhynchi]MDM8102385.1 tripartite tricarboxylate transporter permease [Oceanobacillus oncorhynchi]CEI81013.1 Tripartite tricarboxylate transporter TctA family protein [Oceanobacillus oncorhynchi]